MQIWEMDHKEGWAPKNWGFRKWSWRRLLRVPWTVWRSNQWILKEINPDYLLEGLMLKLQYLDHLMQRANSLEKTLIRGKIEGKMTRGQQRMKRLDSVANAMDLNLSKLRQKMDDRGGWRAAVHGVAKSQTQLSDWTKTKQQFLSLNLPHFQWSFLPKTLLHIWYHPDPQSIHLRVSFLIRHGHFFVKETPWRKSPHTLLCKPKRWFQKWIFQSRL